MAYNAMYNQVGGNFARANDRLQNGEYDGKAISAYSLQVVDASDSAEFVYIRHSNSDYPPIRFERRQMALIPVTLEARTQFADWFCRSLAAGRRMPTPANGAAHLAQRRSHEEFCADLESRYCQAPPAKKKRRLVGAKDSSDEESEPEEDEESEKTEETESEEESDGELSGFVVPDDFVEYDA